MDAMGLGDVGPRVIMGHEFGHHIQYEQNLFVTNPPLPGPEATRRTELMADSFAGYFGAHKKGLALNAKRVVDAIMAFYVVGDCSFTSTGHHGTPNQRERAATWGTEMAMAAQPKSFVLGSLAFAACSTRSCRSSSPRTPDRQRPQPRRQMPRLRPMISFWISVVPP